MMFNIPSRLIKSTHVNYVCTFIRKLYIYDEKKTQSTQRMKYCSCRNLSAVDFSTSEFFSFARDHDARVCSVHVRRKRDKTSISVGSKSFLEKLISQINGMHCRYVPVYQCISRYMQK
jgi:hypothetical protein